MASKPSRTSSRPKLPSQSSIPAPPSRTARAITPKLTEHGASKPSAKPTARKPLLSGDSFADLDSRRSTTPNTLVFKDRAPQSKLRTSSESLEKEPIKAFLRIRPQLGNEEPTSTPYLEPLSDNVVRMRDPGATSESTKARLRQSLALTEANYTFTHVFPPSTSQSDFFTKTTMPLVREFLVDGQNGLLFAYGVTNSGKTYTVQGGNTEGSAGILPRTLDVIFNSIEGMQGNGQFRPIRLEGIEPNSPNSDPESTLDDLLAAEPALASVLRELADEPTLEDIDPTVIKLDRNYEYSLWISYAEVYNEKVFDLLAPAGSNPGTTSKLPRPTSIETSGGHHPPLLTRRALTVRPSPPSDAWDPDMPAGKYIDGLRHMRMTNASEAKALLKLGQLHRRVFGTLANSQSSRSHSIVTLKLLRQHRGERNNPSAIQTSRLTLVDLAGSERTRNTHASGDRLKEAGSINKSLMVLGQCLETLRANQRRLGQTLSAPGRSDTRDAKRGLQIVPFRHSKMTEILMDYFVGNGRVTMIVNINPYDTGFDENSHVMKFAAIAREISTIAFPKMSRPFGSTEMGRSSDAEVGRVSQVSRRSVTLSLGGTERRESETVFEVLEVDEEPLEDEEDADPMDGLVEALFEEIEDLRTQLFESELRVAMVEAETREEVMAEAEQRMRQMELMFRQRLREEVEAHELKTDAKIEMLHRVGMWGGSRQPAPIDEDNEDMLIDENSVDRLEEEDIEKSLREDGDLADDVHGSINGDHSLSPSPTPVQSKGKPSSISQEIEMMQVEPVESEEEEEEEEEDFSPPPPRRSKGKSKSKSFASDSDEYEPPPKSKAVESESDGSYELPPSRGQAKVKSKAKAKGTRISNRGPGHIATSEAASTGRSHNSPLMSSADLDDVNDDSVLVVPNKKARQAATASGRPNVEYVPTAADDAVDTVKKKKRQLVKKPVLTEDQIERMVERQNQDGKTVRRMPRKRTTGGT